jgi:hypothetical protein
VDKPRVLMVAVSRYSREVTEYLKAVHQEIDVVLYFSRKELADYIFPKRKKHADYIIPSVATMRPRRGRQGYLMKRHVYSGVLAQMLSEGQLKFFYEFLFHFSDQMVRASRDWRSKGHKLSSLHEYMDYIHLASDLIAHKINKYQVDTVIFMSLPHLAWDLITFQIAKLLGIRTIVFSQSLLPGYFFSAASHMDFGKLDWSKLSHVSQPYQINKHKNQKHFYMRDVTQWQGEYGQLTVSDSIDILWYICFKEPALLIDWPALKIFLKQLRSIKQRFPSWRDPFSHYFLRRNLNYFLDIIRFERQEIDWSQHYVYFPLQLQPEASTSALGGMYVDQALAIEHLSKILPESCKIYVKENPKQQSFMRHALFFHRLCRIKQVVIVPSYTDTNQLLDHAVFTATISGTVGWESICKGKNVVTFGSVWYNSFPGVFPFSFNLSFDQIRHNVIDHDALERTVGRFITYIPKGIIDLAYVEQLQTFDSKENLRLISTYIVDVVLKRKDLVFS